MVQTPRGTVVESCISPGGKKLNYLVPDGGVVLVFDEHNPAETVKSFNLTRTSAQLPKIYLECDGPNVLRVLSRDLTNKLHRYEFLDLRYMGIDRDTTVRMREALLELLKINPTMPT